MKTLLLSAEIVCNMDIGLETVQTNIKDLIVFYVVKIHMILSIAMRNCVLNVIKLGTKLINAGKKISQDVINAGKMVIENIDA